MKVFLLASLILTALGAPAHAREFSLGEKAGQCAGGAVVMSAVLAPATAAVYITEKNPNAARNVAGLIAAGGCGLAMYGASIDPANASPAEGELRATETESQE